MRQCQINLSQSAPAEAPSSQLPATSSQLRNSDFGIFFRDLCRFAFNSLTSVKAVAVETDPSGWPIRCLALHFFVSFLFSPGDFTNRIENLFTAMWQQFTLMRHKPCVSQSPRELAFPISISIFQFHGHGHVQVHCLCGVANKVGLARCAPFNLARMEDQNQNGNQRNKIKNLCPLCRS